MKQTIALLLVIIIANTALKAQLPVGKYNTTNYAKDRKAIELLKTLPDSLQHLNDDYLAVGPEGKISYGYDQWKKGFTDKGATFKSVKPVPGMGMLRIYNGDAAVRHDVLDVVFDTPQGDLKIRVIRMECYVKQDGKWYFVQGQGTRALSKEEIEEMSKTMTHKN